jgi:hypothetical protein
MTVALRRVSAGSGQRTMENDMRPRPEGHHLTSEAAQMAMAPSYPYPWCAAYPARLARCTPRGRSHPPLRPTTISGPELLGLLRQVLSAASLARGATAGSGRVASTASRERERVLRLLPTRQRNQPQQHDPDRQHVYPRGSGAVQ